MNRKHLTGLLLAASTMTAGTLAVVHAQDTAAEKPAAAAEDKAPANAGDKAPEAHEHEHTPTTIHTADGKAFELDDEKAYPDADGFKSMADRISYAFGRNLGRQIPQAQPDMNTKSFAAGIRVGLAETNADYALGYSQGFELARRFLDQRSDEIELEAFIKGVAAAIKEQDQDKGMGYLYGNSFREAELGITPESMVVGLEEGVASATPVDPTNPDQKAPELKLSEEQVQETLEAFNIVMQNKQREEAIAEGKDYIDGLKKEDGWQKTESGIAYKVVKAGEGESPDENDRVTMNYEGSLLDGTVFDSSYESGMPLIYEANRLIAGWTEILQMMKPGAHFEVVIPYQLAYGESGSRSIPPYATLKFKMEMISFEKIENEKKPEEKKPAENKPAE